MPIFKLLTAVLLGALMTQPAWSEARVAVSIKPLHSLVTAVTGELAQVQLLVGDNSSPHLYSMKASSARALADADLVVWAGEGMERFLVGPIKALAAGTRQLQLAALPGMHTLPLRANPLNADAGAHGHDDEHGHGEIDYHLWLEPDNAQTAIRAIAAVLGEIDPANEQAYLRNADDFAQRLEHEVEAIAARMQPLQQRPYLTLHDSFQYFENYFGLQSAGVIAIQPDIRPGAATVQRLNDAIVEQQIGCVFSEPQFSKRLINRLVEGHKLRTAELDPIGVELASGANLYLELLRANASAFERCLAPGDQ